MIEDSCTHAENLDQPIITTAPTEANLRTSELDISASSLKQIQYWIVLPLSEVLIANITLSLFIIVAGGFFF